MKDKLPKDWQVLLADEWQKPYMEELTLFYKSIQDEEDVFPNKNQVFNAFQRCAVEDVKVVIVGQDPYPTRGHANGLCFSLNPNVQPLAKSLQNIYRELVEDINCEPPVNGDLTKWANQGVLLLNAILTVKEGTPQSHKNKGWEKLTDAIIQKISQHKENVVFILWGNYAIKKGKSIDASKHLILTSGHPSPLSANQGKWFGNKHFSLTNTYLLENGIEPIDWTLDTGYNLFN